MNKSFLFLQAFKTALSRRSGRIAHRVGFLKKYRFSVKLTLRRIAQLRISTKKYILVLINLFDQ